MPGRSAPFVLLTACAQEEEPQAAPVRGVVGRAASIADLAVRLGWYDQAHFINDFRSMLASTPGEYADIHGG